MEIKAIITGVLLLFLGLGLLFEAGMKHTPIYEAALGVMVGLGFLVYGSIILFG